MFYWVFAIAASLLQGWQSDMTLQYTGYTFTLAVIYMNIQSELDAICIKSSDQEFSKK